MKYDPRKIVFRLSAIAAAASVLFSCAKAEPEDLTILEKKTFEAWIEEHVKGKGIEVAEQSNGIYVEFMEDGDQSLAPLPDSAMWFRLDYTATDVRGNVFVTRDSIEALRQRTYTPYTHYNSDYLFAGEENFGMIEGQYFALRNELVKPDGSTMRMAPGAHVRLYIPSFLAYGSAGFSDSQGYGGQYSLDGSKIIIEDVRVKEVIEDPIGYEEELVSRRALQDWGLTVADTLSALLYIDSVHLDNLDRKFKPRADIEAQFPNRQYRRIDSLGVDSLAKIRFIGKFLEDGFIFDTNIQSVHDEFYNRRADEDYPAKDKNLVALSFTPSTDKSNFIPAFNVAIPKMRRGLWYRLVFTSAYGYGATGLSARLRQEQEYYRQYMSYVYSSMYYNNMYGNGYGGYGGYYDNYYGDIYNNPYLDYSSSAYSQNKQEQQIITEIQPYTPLVFEIYIEPID